MPVKFHGDYGSEYQKNYGNAADYTSPLLQAEDQIVNTQKGFANEPPLQRKKRPIEYQRTDPIAFEADGGRVDDGYYLLGSNNKFADNVKYKSKSLERPRRKKTSPEKQNGANVEVKVKTPAAPRKEKQSAPPPPPKVIYNTGAPILKPKLATPKDMKAAGKPSGAVIDSKRVEKYLAATQPQQKQADAKKEAKKEAKLAATQPQERPAKEVKQAASKPSKEKKSALKLNSRTVDGKLKQEMNEFVQTDLTKGVADSGQEAPADYAMKYKAGVAAPRTRGPKRLSEYAMQFTWKGGKAASPLLAAEQIVYKNNPAVPPASQAAMPHSSTYDASYKPWQMIKSTPNLAEAFVDDQASEITPAKKAKMKRSRSVEDVSELPPAGVEPITTEEDKRLVKESVNPQRLHFPHGKHRRYNSTYSSNFRSPAQFMYEDGTWKGAAPAHLAAKDAERATESASSSWFSEVQELRRRAAEYKHRAMGTHFSRSHVGQLFAEQAALWDTDSTVTDPPPSAQLAEALDLHTARSSSVPPQSTQRSSESAPTSRSVGSRTMSMSSTARTAPTVIEDDEEEGRIPTPQLRASVTPSRRHHLDRTTPMVGGAMLTAPQAGADDESSTTTGYSAIAGQNGATQPIDCNPAAVMRQTVKKPRKKRAGSVQESVDSHVPLGKTAARPLALPPSKQSNEEQHKVESSNPSGQAPVFGVATRDTHPLLDEVASTDRPMPTYYTQSPPIQAVKKVRERKSSNVPSTIQEGMGETYSQPPVRNAWVQANEDDGDVSVSNLSVVSACSSLASDVLERARSRQQFWRP